MDVNLLKSEIIKNGLSISRLIDQLNQEEGVQISKSSFYKKLRGETEFTRDEIRGISRIVDLDEHEIYQIFFTELLS